MNLAISSKAFGRISFFMDSDGGYIFLESPGRPGTLGQQICKGGDFTGSTLTATPETFEAVCRLWHQQHAAECSAYGSEYGNGQRPVGRPPIPEDERAKNAVTIRLTDHHNSRRKLKGIAAYRAWLDEPTPEEAALLASEGQRPTS